MPGVTDWNLKRTALKTLFSAFGDREFVRAIVGDTPDGERIVANGLLGRWTDHDPRQHAWFFTKIAEKLGSEHGCSSEMTGTVIIRSAYVDFLALLPAEKRVGLPKAHPIGDPRPEEQHARALDAPVHPIWVWVGAKLETILDGIKRGHIDQQHYYLSPESAVRWINVIDCAKYPTFDECRAGLRELTKCNTWNRFLSQGGIDGVVMLGGGGAPTKDMEIINSLLKYFQAPDARVHYALVDISYYMLESSFQWLDSRLKLAGIRKCIILTTLKWDFMDLAGARGLIRREGKGVAWFLTGQTLGNINEDQFFQSVRRKAEPDDLLIVGAEFIGEGDSREDLEATLSKFDNAAIREFVTTPILSVCSALDTGIRLKDALHRIKIQIVEGSEYSSVPGTHNVEISLNLEGKKITLVTSARYEEAKLIEFAHGYGFQHAETIRSPMNPNYRHVVFTRHGGKQGPE